MSFLVIVNLTVFDQVAYVFYALVKNFLAKLINKADNNWV